MLTFPLKKNQFQKIFMNVYIGFKISRMYLSTWYQFIENENFHDDINDV